MTPDEIWAAYQNFTDTAVRLETLQHYTVPGDEERQRAFREGRPLPPRPDKSATVRLIEDAVAAGKTLARMHIIDYPLAPYVRYEIEAAYPENAAAGEQVWIADRAAHPDLAAMRRDFVLFDAHTDHGSVIWFDYNSRGEISGYERGTAVDVTVCAAAVDLAHSYAVPLAEFMTHHREAL